MSCAAVWSRISSDYADAAKPQIDWDDAAPREALVDSRSRGAMGMLALLEDRSRRAPSEPGTE
ncbi:hypothetical protein AB0F91_44140 [Amycolatopsis sp. NPDC023774]|uniref:hypothetical protein n=1 Tax=Amycolatopsis sp. NPDC023774 TaxID=3155015 RepID=UPI0033DC8975